MSNKNVLKLWGLLLMLSSPVPGFAVEIRFLANEGVLISNGENKVIIDGFLTEISYERYGALQGENAEQLMHAKGPFAGIDIGLASHVHLDHFQPLAALAFLNHSNGSLFASSPQVLNALHEIAEPPAESTTRLVTLSTQPLWPQSGDSVEIARSEIIVKAFQLSHGTGRFAEIQNLAHLINIGGFNILHIGDAAMNPDNFAEAGVDQLDIDIALIPHWYFLSPEGRSIVEDFLSSDHKIALHITPAEQQEVSEFLSTNFPDVRVFERSMQTLSFARSSQ